MAFENDLALCLDHLAARTLYNTWCGRCLFVKEINSTGDPADLYRDGCGHYAGSQRLEPAAASH